VAEHAASGICIRSFR